MLTHRGRGERAIPRWGIAEGAKHGQAKDRHKPRYLAWKELIHGKRGGVVALTYVRAAWRLRQYSD